MKIADYELVTYPMVLQGNGFDSHRIEIMMFRNKRVLDRPYSMMVGHASLDIRYKSDDEIAAICWLHVKEEYRNKGLATKIIEEAYKECQEHNIKQLLLSADKSPVQDMLVDFYSNRGFVPYETDEDGNIFMRRMVE
jgi:GNAT superfamily N-acetyltransferase